MHPAVDYGFPTKQVRKQVNYTFSLSNNGQWTQFPELQVNFMIAEPRMVGIGYNIQVDDSSEKFLCTRVMINGQ